MQSFIDLDTLVGSVPFAVVRDLRTVVVDQMPDGTRVTRFTPVSVARTPWYLDELCARFLATQAAGQHRPVVLVGLSALDLLTILPFGTATAASPGR